MCGIIGAFAFSPGAREPVHSEVAGGRDAMASRGPDGSAIWASSEGRACFGHRRLAIIDLAARSDQPMTSADGRFTIVFNGEIYNYRELRSRLQKDHGALFRTNGDTEVLLALYAEHGPSMLEHLRGMFAFAIHDAKKDEVFAARDPFGIKPFYYAVENGTFYFASQVRALETFGAVSRELDPAGTVGFFLLGSVPEPFTIRRSVRALPAGHHISVRAGQSQPQLVAYARMADLMEREGSAPASTAREASFEFAQHVRASVEAHLVADVPVGLFLSAGIDSGALAGLMRDCGQNRITAITMSFEELRGTDRDETPMSRLVARHYDLEHHICVVTQDEFATFVQDILSAMDQPSVDGVNTWMVSKAASELDLKVVLSGLGGDELLGGYDNFSRVPRMARTARLIKYGGPLRHLARSALKYSGSGLLRDNPKLLGLFDQDGGTSSSYLLARTLLLPWEVGQVLDNEIVREGFAQLRLEERTAALLQPQPPTSFHEISLLESSMYMRNQLLRDSDWASMAHSVELRVPLVDWSLLRATIPLQHHFGGGLGKLALANAPARPLPKAVQSRPRSGFTVPVGTWSGMSGSATHRLSSRYWMQRVADQFAIPRSA